MASLEELVSRKEYALVIFATQAASLVSGPTSGTIFLPSQRPGIFRDPKETDFHASEPCK